MYGQRIRELRTERNLSQAELAKVLGTTQRTVSKYETEVLDLNTSMIVCLCRFFEVSADYLLGINDNY